MLLRQLGQRLVASNGGQRHLGLECLDVEPVLLLSSTYVRAIETAPPCSEKTNYPSTP